MDTVSVADQTVALHVLDGQHRTDVGLKAACRRLAAPHYAAFDALFERDWAFCRRGCFIISNGRLTGFILAEVHEVIGLGRTLFMGLSAGEADRAGRAETVKAYMLCVLEAARISPPIAWVWGTTISPIIFDAVSSYLADVAPQPDGEFDDDHACAAALIVGDRAPWGWPEPDSACPFVLKGVSPAVRYSVAELDRLATMSGKAPIFGAWRLSEAEGDRLLFVGRLPPQRSVELLARRVLRGSIITTLGVDPGVV